MSKTLQWIIGVGAIVVVAAIVFSVVWPFVAPQSAWNRLGMGGPGHMFGGGGMMGGFGLPLFGLGMLVWPLLIVGLIVLGVVWLVRATSASGAQPGAAAGVSCAHCGKPLQLGWKACPYCGERTQTA